MRDMHSDGKKLDECWRRRHGRPCRAWFSHIREDTDISLQTLWSLEIAKDHKARNDQRPCDDDDDDNDCFLCLSQL